MDDTKVLIDELPLRKWTHDYKQWLEQQIVGDDKTTAWLKDFKENHTDTTVASRARTKLSRLLRRG